MVQLAPHVNDGFEVFHMGAEAVEIGAAGIDKASGLQWLCAHLGIEAREVMAFGDNTNDHSMLVWVGRSVAMGNSSPATQALATNVALSNADDGVAVFIEQLLEAHRRRVDA
jgi:hydroxymethylpyrimidine pyrophosphatase-like HAD family hydrolase